MKRILGVSLLAAALLYAGAPADSAKRIYDTGIRQTAEGRLAEARATLQSLVNAYPQDPLTLPAKCAIDAVQLFEEGQARVKAGKYETARVAFETLIAVYPENPLSARAQSEVAAIAGKENASRPLVKSVQFREIQMPLEEILAAMDAREVRLSVGKPCRSKDIEQARVALEEILAQTGAIHARVDARTLAVTPGAVDVIFTGEKPRTSLLRSPWRLAVAGWHRVQATGL